MNNKFWESARPGDDIQIICHPDDSKKLDVLLEPISEVIKAFGPFPVFASVAVEAGKILFLNKSLPSSEIPMMMDNPFELRDLAKMREVVVMKGAAMGPTTILNDGPFCTWLNTVCS